MRLLNEMRQRRDSALECGFLELTPAERREAAETLTSVANQPFTDEDIESFLSQVRDCAVLPDHARQRVRDFARHGNTLGFLLLHHLPSEPLNGFRKSTAWSEAILLHIGLLAGEPLGYAGQRNGDVVQNIRPRREDAYKLLGTGSAVELIWHTEDAHAERNCDLIVLFCLRGDPYARTLVSRVEPSDLEAADLQELQRPQFVIRSDESYSGSRTERTQAVIAFDGDQPVVKFDPPFTYSPTPTADAALERLRAHIDARAVAVTLQSGDALLIDNRAAVHARTVFRPRFDDTDRWIQRTAVFTGPVPAHLIEPGRPRVIVG